MLCCWHGWRLDLEKPKVVASFAAANGSVSLLWMNFLLARCLDRLCRNPVTHRCESQRRQEFHTCICSWTTAMASLVFLASHLCLVRRQRPVHQCSAWSPPRFHSADQCCCHPNTKQAVQAGHATMLLIDSLRRFFPVQHPHLIHWAVHPNMGSRTMWM